MDHNNQPIILIPSLELEDGLLSYIRTLKTLGLSRLLVVDDGSGARYQPIFQALEQEGCTVLCHPENRGKGAALKTGFHYIKEHFSAFACVVTADSDGQHAAKDVLRLAREAEQHPDALILGTRNFSQSGTPPRSLMGNRITSFLFRLLYGKRLPDTQTGLRAFGPALLERIIAIKGSRFEYEIQMLITCVQTRIPIRLLSIETIYENANRSTHFKAIRDSARIMGIVFSSFFKFIFSSVVSSLVDLGLAFAFMDLLTPYLSGQDFWRILLATGAARLVSITVNYLLNRHLVFRAKQPGPQSLPRYLCLCILVLLLSASGVFALQQWAHIDEKLAKIICDTILFLLNYQLQQRWVFQRKRVGS